MLTRFALVIIFGFLFSLILFWAFFWLVAKAIIYGSMVISILALGTIGLLAWLIAKTNILISRWF